MKNALDTLKVIPIASPQIGEEERKAVLAVLDSGQLAQGPVVEKFEREFARWCGVRFAVAVNSGTAALHLLMLAHGLREGDEVITTPFTFIASANAILYTGARPVFVDIESDTFNIDPSLVEKAITPRTKAILAVDLYGHPADVGELKAIAERHGLLLLEDACQAHGATVDGVRTGALGADATFSFYPTKNITTGEGGMVATADPDIAHRVRLLRQHGADTRYVHDIVGYNFRMTEIAAAIGVAQLAKLDRFNATRKANAAVLTRGLHGITGLRAPIERQGFGHVYHQYTVVVEKYRDRLQQKLRDLGIGTAVHYPIPVHRQPAYRDLGYEEVSLPVAERLADQVLSLPVHTGLSQADISRIVGSVRQALASL
jgi:dTDP-4-amino-4,6-dideoxygalactose transaminase